jgi:hypothetical protein
MSPVDEGRLHAWLDGALSAEEAAAVETLVRDDAAWAAAAAEARGLIANASRLVRALDDGVVGGIGNAGRSTLVAPVPSERQATSAAPSPRGWRVGRQLGAIAAVLLVAVVGRAAWKGSAESEPRVPADSAPPVARPDTAPPIAAASPRPARPAAPARAEASAEQRAVDRAGRGAPVDAAPPRTAAPGEAPVAKAAEAEAPVAKAAEAVAPVASPPSPTAGAASARAPAAAIDSVAARREALAERLRRSSVQLDQVVVTGVGADGRASARPVTWLEDHACVRLTVRWASDADLPAARAEIVQEVRGLRIEGDSARFEVSMPAQRVDGTPVATQARIVVGLQTGQGTAQLVRPDGSVARTGGVTTTARCP